MLFGARLARAGNRVALCGRWKEGLRALQAGGVQVSGTDSPWSVNLETVELGDEPHFESDQTAALALILVKSEQSREIGRRLPYLVSPSGDVLTLQNGLGNRECLESAAGRPVALGVTTAAARVVGPGCVREVSTGRTVLPARQEEFARRLGSAGFDVATSRDIEPHVWLKLAINCAINPVTALEGITNGELLERPAARRLAVAAASEVAALAAARGVVLTADPAQEALRVASRTAANVSSMLQDVRRGRATEIEVLAGAVVARGRQVGVPTPVNERLLREVRRLAGAEHTEVLVGAEA